MLSGDFNFVYVVINFISVNFDFSIVSVYGHVC